MSRAPGAGHSTIPHNRPLVPLVLTMVWALLTILFFERYTDALLQGYVSPFVAGSVFLVGAIGFLVFLTELVMGLAVARHETRWRARLLVWTLALLLVTVEVGLRLTVTNLSTWQEQNRGNYSSAFGMVLHSWVMVSAPNQTSVPSKPEFAFEKKTNSEGLRDVEHPKSKPHGAFRIIALGDSFTEGAGAAAEDAWPRQLERRLNARYPERDITVINGGVSGSDPWFEYVLLERRLLAYEPDLVIVAANNSDVFDMMARGGEERFQDDGTVRMREGPSWEWLYASSYVARLVVHVALGYNRELIKKDVWEREVRAASDHIFESIRRFQALSVERGFDFVVVFHPHAGEVRDRALELRPLVERLRQDGIQVVNALEYVLEEANVTEDNLWDYYWKLDRHHNAKGYALLAEAIEASLVRRGLVEPGR